MKTVVKNILIGRIRSAVEKDVTKQRTLAEKESKRLQRDAYLKVIANPRRYIKTDRRYGLRLDAPEVKRGAHSLERVRSVVLDTSFDVPKALVGKLNRLFAAMERHALTGDATDMADLIDAYLK